jgi:hypothetical protein
VHITRLPSGAAALTLLLLSTPPAARAGEGSAGSPDASKPRAEPPAAPDAPRLPATGKPGALAGKALGGSIQEKKYVHARGLGDRYSNALLNGAPLPSPEPDRRAVPLGAIPPVVRSSITLERFFTPDQPGDFAAGSLQLHVWELPKQLLFKVNMTGGVNTMSSFRENRAYAGGADYFGFDDGTRRIPSAVPSNQPVLPPRLLRAALPQPRPLGGAALGQAMAARARRAQRAQPAHLAARRGRAGASLPARGGRGAHGVLCPLTRERTIAR